MFKQSILTILVAFLLVACGGSGGGNSNDSSGSTISLKGDLQSGVHASLKYKIIRFFVNNAYAINESLVHGVIIFYPDGKWKTLKVVNGKFDINIRDDSPSVLGFYDSAEGLVGVLSFGSGVDALPIPFLKNTTKEIDLGILSSTGKILTSSEPILDSNLFEDISTIKSIVATMDDFSASLVRNSDMDDNGKIDVFEGKEYRVFPTYFINAGSFDVNGSTTLNSGNSLLNGYKIFFHTNTNNAPAQIYFSGPAGSGLSNTPDDGDARLQSGNNMYFSQFITTPKNPPTGEYVINYGGMSLNFSLSDQDNFTNSIILAKPSFNFDNSGILTNIEWSWVDSQGNSNPDLVSKVIKNVQIQIDGSGHDRIYNSIEFSSSVSAAKIQGNISVSDISAVYFAYDDVYGTHYVAQYYPN